MSFLQIKQVGVVQCNATAFCLDGQTCCRLASGQWGCCPYPNAVCCSDGQHCCPNGYTCDVSSGHCTKSREGETIPYLEKTAAVSISRVIVSFTVTDAIFFCSTKYNNISSEHNNHSCDNYSWDEEPVSCNSGATRNFEGRGKENI